MAGGEELLVSQIAGNLGHERAWNLGEKKDGDGVPFYLLLAPVMHRGLQNRCGKKWWRSGLCRSKPGEDSGEIGGVAGVDGFSSP